MSVAFDETVLRHVAAEVRTIKHQYRGLVSEESIDRVADESLRRLADSTSRNSCRCSSAASRASGSRKSLARRQ